MAEIARGLPKWQPEQMSCQTFLVRGLLLANTVPNSTKKAKSFVKIS